MASQKDKDYHKLRNPEMYPELRTGRTNPSGHRDKITAEAHARYNAIWNKYGNKSMVGDKRRRNSTRKSNQKDKQIKHQIERATNKRTLQAHFIDLDKPTITLAGHGSLY